MVVCSVKNTELILLMLISLYIRMTKIRKIRYSIDHSTAARILSADKIWGASLTLHFYQSSQMPFTISDHLISEKFNILVKSLFVHHISNTLYKALKLDVVTKWRSIFI